MTVLLIPETYNRENDAPLDGDTFDTFSHWHPSSFQEKNWTFWFLRILLYHFLSNFWLSDFKIFYSIIHCPKLWHSVSPTYPMESDFSFTLGWLETAGKLLSNEPTIVYELKHLQISKNDWFVVGWLEKAWKDPSMDLIQRTKHHQWNENPTNFQKISRFFATLYSWV